jgi:hypothetical protein
VECSRQALRHPIEVRDDFAGGLVADAHIGQVAHYSPQLATALGAGLDVRVVPSFPAEQTAHYEAQERKTL